MTRFVRAPGTVQRVLTDGVLVLAPTAPQAVSIAGSAVAVWEALATPRTLDELVGAMQGRFRGDPDLIARDVAATVTKLVGSGVLAEVDP